MAEALLESDESTASLSEASMDGEIFEESHALSSTSCLNPGARSFKPRNRRRVTCEVGIVSPPMESYSPPSTYRLHSRPFDAHTTDVVSPYVALDCESKFSEH